MPCCCAQAAQRIQFVGNAMRILRNSVCEPHAPSVRQHPRACMRAVARPASSVAQPLPLLQRARSVSVTDDERAVFTAMLRAEQA